MAAVRFADTEDLPALLVRLARSGHKIYSVDCSSVHDMRSFFEAALRQLPMGDAAPADVWRFPSNWNAFKDFLWQGLTDRKDQRVAILLEGLIGPSKDPLLEDMIGTFQDVAAALQKGDAAWGVPPIKAEFYVLR